MNPYDELRDLKMTSVAATGVVIAARQQIKKALDEHKGNPFKATENVLREPAIPLGPATAPGCDEPTSRCQTPPSMMPDKYGARLNVDVIESTVSIRGRFHFKLALHEL